MMFDLDLADSKLDLEGCRALSGALMSYDKLQELQLWGKWACGWLIARSIVVAQM